MYVLLGTKIDFLGQLNQGTYRPVVELFISMAYADSTGIAETVDRLLICI